MQGKLYLVAEEELQTVRVKDEGNGREKKKKEREHFIKLTLRNKSHIIMLPVFKYSDIC